MSRLSQKSPASDVDMATIRATEARGLQCVDTLDQVGVARNSLAVAWHIANVVMAVAGCEPQWSVLDVGEVVGVHRLECIDVGTAKRSG